MLKVEVDGLVLFAHFFLSGIQCRAGFKITDFEVNIRVEILVLPFIDAIALKSHFPFPFLNNFIYLFFAVLGLH